MKTLNIFKLWLLLLLCLTHGCEARSFHNRKYQNPRRISIIHQRQMRSLNEQMSLTHTARCRRYILLLCLENFHFYYAKVHLLLWVQGNYVKKESGFKPRDWVGEKAASAASAWSFTFSLKVQSKHELLTINKTYTRIFFYFSALSPFSVTSALWI